LKKSGGDESSTRSQTYSQKFSTCLILTTDLLGRICRFDIHTDQPFHANLFSLPDDEIEKTNFYSFLDFANS